MRYRHQCEDCGQKFKHDGDEEAHRLNCPERTEPQPPTGFTYDEQTEAIEYTGNEPFEEAETMDEPTFRYKDTTQGKGSAMTDILEKLKGFPPESDVADEAHDEIIRLRQELEIAKDQAKMWATANTFLVKGLDNERVLRFLKGFDDE